MGIKPRAAQNRTMTLTPEERIFFTGEDRLLARTPRSEFDQQSRLRGYVGRTLRHAASFG